jgi:putative PEP-CTERM system histidine kinase
LVGVVILARPKPDRTLDWEDFDLLRAAGRQVASYLAEARGQEALSDARRFDEFNRRFAFIMHDIKNLVSQLGLVTRNAERHADNPAFRADMIETLRASTTKMNDLLARLSQHHRARAEEPRDVALGPIVDAVVSQHRPLHHVAVSGRRDILAVADPARLRQAIGHLVQNAVDAGDGIGPVSVRLGLCGCDATIEVIDQGCGMSAEFIRTSLFRPFASTKDGGFGVGAFEARALVAAMGGRLEVESREGEGSRFTILLPLADATDPAMPLMASA